MRFYLNLFNVHSDEYVIVGPIDGVQITYDSLRETKQGEDIAYWKTGDGWIVTPHVPSLQGHRFTDIIVLPEDEVTVADREMTFEVKL